MYLFKIMAGGVLFLALQINSKAADSTSFELATGNKTQIERVGVQWEWQKNWWISNGTHLGGYWDLSAARWKENRYQNIAGLTHNISDIGFTPVFRFQKDGKLGLYIEAATGAHFLSDNYHNNGRRLSTHFQFGTHLAVGYVFRNEFDIGIKLEHFSNGGYEEPNDGVNLIGLRLSYGF